MHVFLCPSMNKCTCGCMCVFHSFYIFEFFVHCKKFSLTWTTITMYVLCVCGEGGGRHCKSNVNDPDSWQLKSVH